jgi:uncharacterized membrane protein
MFQFRVRTLLYLTTFVAALVLMFRDDRLTIVGLAGFAMYITVIVWYVYRNRHELKTILPDESEQEKRPD